MKIFKAILNLLNDIIPLTNTLFKIIKAIYNKIKKTNFK